MHPINRSRDYIESLPTPWSRTVKTAEFLGMHLDRPVVASLVGIHASTRVKDHARPPDVLD